MKQMKFTMMFVMLLLAGLTQAQQRFELTVTQAVDLAYKNVIELKNAQVDYKIQEARNREILGQAYPQLTGNAAANHYLKLPVILFPQSDAGVYNVLKAQGLIPQNTVIPAPTSAAFSIQQPWNLQVGATLQQLLFQPDVFVGLQARQAALDVSNSAIDVVKEKIKDSAYKRYYAILIAEKQLFYTDESMQRLKKLYREDSLAFINGFRERLDLDRNQVQINNLQSTRNTIVNAINISYAALKLAIGVAQSDTVVLKEELSTANIKNGLLDESFKYEDRAAVRQLGNVIKLQELDVKRNRLGWLPTVAFGANYTLSAQGQKFFTNSNTLWINSAYVGLNINMPIFDGGQRRYRTERSVLEVEKTNNNLTFVKQVIDFEQTATKNSLRIALTDLDVQERNMQLAEKVFNTSKLKYTEGLGSSADVLLADTELQRAQANYFNALYNAIIARISYQNSLGKL